MPCFYPGHFLLLRFNFRKPCILKNATLCIKCCIFLTVYISVIFSNTLPLNLILQIYFHKNGISFILTYPKIPFCNSKRRVIENLHQKNWRYSLFPGMIAKCFPQGMTTDVRIVNRFGCCLFYNTVRLGTANGNIKIRLF